MDTSYLISLTKCIAVTLPGLVNAIGFVGVVWTITSFENHALAQVPSNIIPDTTLGNDSSIVIPDFNGLPIEVINGGAIRGINLFHSFGAFNVSEGRGAYFFSPSTDIQNILARVTGGNPSQILGVIGTFGNSNPNLFLMNPYGIIFGPNSGLDVGGSFVGTTANAIGFGNQGFFRATEPNAPPLLTVNPSAFLFNQLPAQAITNQSVGSLQVPQGQSLLLLGGEVNLDGGLLVALGGRVQVVGVAEAGTVELNGNGNNLSLSVPIDLGLADVSLTNGAGIYVADEGGGNIAIAGRNVDILSGSRLDAGIAEGLGSLNAQAGDITIYATEAITLANQSLISNYVLPGAVGNAGNVNIITRSLFVNDGTQLSTSTMGQGNAGSVNIAALDTVSFEGGSSAFSTVESEGVGNGGSINITTGTLSAIDGAQLVANTRGLGNAGSIRINARDTVTFDGVDGNGIFSAATSRVQSGAVGNGGDIEIATGALFVRNGASLVASTAGQGNAGSVTINAYDRVWFDRDSSATSSVQLGAVGNGGDININTGSLSVTNSAFLAAKTAGQGNAGSVNIAALDTVTFDGVDSNGFASSATSSVESGGVGNGGGINITTGSLFVMNGALLSASTFGKGNAGSITITARDTVSFAGESTNGFFSSAFSSVQAGAEGQGGDINITTGSLSVTNGAQLSASTFGQGNAGSVTITALNTAFFDGAGSNGFSSGAFSNVVGEAVGKGGDVNITTGSLSVTNGAQLSASTFGQGDAGKVTITARDAVTFDGVGSNGASSGAASQVAGGVGKGGDVNISSGSLSVTNGAQLSASTFGTGPSGSVIITARDSVFFSGEGSNGISSGAFSNVAAGAVGKGGDVRITTGSLSVTNGAQLGASTFGQGDAGRVIITARDVVTFDGEGSDGFPSAALSSVQAGGVGNAGGIDIQARSLFVSNKAKVSVSSLGSGNAGDLQVQADLIQLENEGKLTSETLSGNGGNISLQVQDLLLMRHNSLISTTAGTAQAGGDGGNITINAPFIIGIPKENSDITANAYTGKGGNIQITATAIFGLEFRPQLTPLSDITASSQFGLQGTVLINTPGVDPSRGLTNLPTDVNDASNQIAQNCSTQGGKVRQNEFIVTGRGGLPDNPGDTLNSDAVWTDLRTPTSTTKIQREESVAGRAHTSQPPIVEANGWVINDKGEVVLTASAPTVTPHNPSLTPSQCDREKSKTLSEH